MKPAFVELVDQQDGTFQLKIRPQEPGNHQLFVTFCGEPIQGGLCKADYKVAHKPFHIHSFFLEDFLNALTVKT